MTPIQEAPRKEEPDPAARPSVVVAPAAVRKRPSRKVITAFMVLVLLGLLAGIAVVFWTLLGPGVGNVPSESVSYLNGSVPVIATTLSEATLLPSASSHAFDPLRLPRQ